MEPSQIVNAVKNAGIIGAGGGGFPTHIKLQAKVDTIIANGSECEPLLSSDKTLMLNRPDLLIDGLTLAMHACGASKGIIGIKGHYKNVVDSVKNALPKDGVVSVHLLDNYYPAGDEFLLVKDITGKVIPEGGLPLQVGVLVGNVLTLSQVYSAVHGKPVTERYVTLNGEFNEPKVVCPPIGTTYLDLIKIAGGLKQDDAVLIDGGPMMGNIVNNIEDGVRKTTSGVIALPKEHFIVKMKMRPLSQMLHQSKAACCQCIRCTDLCPRNLIGHDIHPHMTMRTVDYNMHEPTKHVTSAFLCSGCGVCEMIACDVMRLSPKRIYAEYKKQLTTRGIKSPHTRTNVEAHSEYASRKTSISMTVKKLGLTNYKTELPFVSDINVNNVHIALNQHIGAPSVPIVTLGQKVQMGDLIAKTDDSKLGTSYHASITGVVSAVSETWIEIKAQR